MEIFPHALDVAARTVLQALANGVWQGTALTLGLALLLPLLPGANAATRHAIWCAALGVVVLLPLLSLRSDAPPLATPAAPVVVETAASPGPAPRARAAPTAWTLPSPAHPWPSVILSLLAAVGLFRLGGIVHGVHGLRGLKRNSQPLGADVEGRLAEALERLPSRGVQIRRSAAVTNPITIGFRRPMVLLPSDLIGEMSDAELLQVTLHELSHVRRRDDWVNLAQRVLEAVFFFHPAVRWIGARMELEREIACDDQVVAQISGHRAYALCLTRMAELALGGSGRLAPSIAPARSQLARRIRALLAPNRSDRPGASAAAAAAAAALLVGGSVGLQRTAPGIELAARAAPAPAILAAARVLPAQPSVVAAEVPPPEPRSASPVVVALAPAPAGPAEGVPRDRSDEGPVPHVVSACGAACGAPSAAIVERVRVVEPSPRPARMAQRGAPSNADRPRAGVAVTIDLAFGPVSLRHPARPANGGGWAPRGRGGWLVPVAPGASGGRFQLRVPGRGGAWRP